ncbi:glycosyltransferase family 4 protein [Pontibacter sp. BT213]|uniref:Glycosyltransferase family 4 protein n=1 Tax=Pontibacter fetidus TaxID=2700082 RepID=A0A6B2GYB9_9BACT|nr:glycosyltransferase family 4 protein [Pontibacter fetidus]
MEWENRPASLPETNAFPLTSHLVNALLRRGYDVVVYTNSNSIPEPIVLHDTHLTVCVSLEMKQPGRRFYKQEIEGLKQHILAYPADIISAFWTYEYAWAALRSGLPTVVSVHDVAYKILLKQFDVFRFVRFLMNEIVVRKTKHLVANSAYTYSILPAWIRKKTTIINNFYPEHLPDLLPETIVKGNYIVSVVQGFTKRKGIPLALKAFAKLRQQHPKLEYHLIGINYEENGLAHAYAKKHNLAEGVRFLGCMTSDELFKHVAGAKVMLHPSEEESFGMAVLEAMVAGTVVVGGKKSGFIPKLLDYGKAGILCDIRSAAAISEAAHRLLADASLRDSYERHARRFAAQHFSEDVIVEQHLNYYNNVLGKTHQPTIAPEAKAQNNVIAKASMVANVLGYTFL